MKNITNKSNEEICEFLLNGKKGDCIELSADRTESGQSNFTNRTIYKDKNVEIVYSYLVVDEDDGDIIQQFFIYSNWWGKIKNSYFTLDGFRGKTSYTSCGVINLSKLQDYNSGGSVKINNKNEKAKIYISDFASFTLYCQRKFKASPSYEVVEVLSQAPNSWVKIEVKLPNGEKYLQEGTSKKDAANRFALNYKQS